MIMTMLNMLVIIIVTSSFACYGTRGSGLCCSFCLSMCRPKKRITKNVTILKRILIKELFQSSSFFFIEILRNVRKVMNPG